MTGDITAADPHGPAGRNLRTTVLIADGASVTRVVLDMPCPRSRPPERALVEIPADRQPCQSRERISWRRNLGEEMLSSGLGAPGSQAAAQPARGGEAARSASCPRPGAFDSGSSDEQEHWTQRRRARDPV